MARAAPEWFDNVYGGLFARIEERREDRREKAVMDEASIDIPAVTYNLNDGVRRIIGDDRTGDLAIAIEMATEPGLIIATWPDFLDVEHHPFVDIKNLTHL